MSDTPEQLDTTPAQAPAAETPAAPEAAQTPAAPETEQSESLLDGAKKLFTAIGRAFKSNPKLSGFALTCAALLETTGQNIIGKRERELLRPISDRHEKASHVLSSHGLDAAKKGWLEQRAKLPTAIGQGLLAEHGEVWSEQDFLEHYEECVQAAKDERNRCYVEALPLCQIISERFVAVASKKVDQMEQYERERHEFFGVPFSRPSDLVLTLRKAIKFAGNRTDEQAGGSSSPREMLPFITDL